MNKIFILLLLLLVVVSCSKPIEITKLQNEFHCKMGSFSNTETVNDYKNKFNITVPKHWNTQLYFDNLQTQVFTADTTKNLTNSFTLNFEFNSGDLKIDDDFKNTEIKNLNESNLQVLKNKEDIFKDKSSIWFVSKGNKQNFDYYLFELFIKYNKVSYYKISSEIYGDENIDERLCKSIAVIETLQFLE